MKREAGSCPGVGSFRQAEDGTTFTRTIDTKFKVIREFSRLAAGEDLRDRRLDVAVHPAFQGGAHRREHLGA